MSKKITAAFHSVEIFLADVEGRIDFKWFENNPETCCMFFLWSTVEQLQLVLPHSLPPSLLLD